MKIIITRRFEKDYLKKISKYLTKKDLAENLKSKNHSFISLHHPYFKFKNKLNFVDFRGILLILENDHIIPLMMFLKKDKKYGENINWQDYKNDILYEYDKAIEDIENGNFEVF